MLPDNLYGRFNNSGLIAWIVATLIGIVMLQLGTINPDLAGLGATWGPILTALSAAVVYAVLWRNSNSKTALLAEAKTAVKA